MTSHVPASVGRRPRVGLGVLAASVGVALVVVHFLDPVGVVGDWTYLAVVVGSGLAAWWGARRHGFANVGVLIALGVSLSASGDVIWQLYVWGSGVDPEVSLADVGWLGSYIAIGAALLALLRRGDDRRRDIDGMIDVAAITVVVLLVQWELVLRDIVVDSSVPVVSRVVWALYPTLDAVLLALVVRAVMAKRLRGSMALLIASGAACWLLADFGYTVLASPEDAGVWLNTGWLIGAILLAAATWRPVGNAAGPRRPDAGIGAVAYGSLALAILPLLLPGFLEVTGFYRGLDPNPVPLFTASVLLVAIAFLRAARSLRAEARLRTELRSHGRRANAVAMNSSDAVAVLDAEGCVLDDAPRLAELVGHPGATTRGVRAFDLVAAADLGEVEATFERCLATPEQTFESELRVQHGDGAERWFSARLVNLIHDPDVAGVVANLHDITDRKRVEQELAHQAFHDGLTGLANRALFTDRVQQALRRNARDGLDTAVIFLDLDAFKTVNDSLGHGPGDDLLREVAARLVGSVRSGDTVARLGGDEFAVLIEQSRRAVEEAQSVGDRILTSLTEPIVVGDQPITVSASLGIAVADAEATAASLLRDADVAMYRAKSAGKAQWVLYEPEMRTAAVERLQLETDLVGALDEGQLFLVYQPVVELEHERVIGFEALLRWRHPTLGVVPPDRFIPLAEANGLIVPIGRWVVEEACRAAARWKEVYPTEVPMTMAVNISARQLAYADLFADVAGALRESGLDPRLLVLEVTETTLVQDPTLAARRLQELRTLGVRVAIDDFGTGYSSLSYLREFPVDILKIDRSFISSITDRQQVPAIVRGLLDLGRTLDVETVAEGVELAVQRDSLRDEQCLLAQGFLFARPLDSADAELLLLELSRSEAGDGAGRTS